MTLKEAFRYQNFLDKLIRTAGISNLRRNSITITKKHLISKADPDAADKEEIIVPEKKYNVDDMVDFLGWLVVEREKLSTAISEAKRGIDFDIDVAIATNKYRQSAAGILFPLQERLPADKIEKGTGYRFNVEGNQTPYYYDIEVRHTYNFDREKSKRVMRELITRADKVSSDIDAAMVNTKVNYDPVFDVNDSFDDVVEGFYKLLHS